MTTNTKQSRSGYAREIMPERVDPDEVAGKTVPIAGENGVQEGRVPPALKKYTNVEARAVSLDEADQLAHKRTIGELPLLGSEPVKTKGTKAMKKGEKNVDKSKPRDFDTLGGSPEPEPGSPELVAEEERMADEYSRRIKAGQSRVGSGEEAPEQVNLKPSQKDIYLSQRKRVTLELVDGSMSMSAIDVKQSKYGVTVIMPLVAEGSVFIPKPGSEITVVHGENRWPCFFPGTYFELEELGLIGLTFVKAEE